jgi:hypothetical protein
LPEGLEQLGWIDGRNVRIDARFGAGDSVRIRKYAAELAALAPDVILAVGNSALPAVLQATQTVPIVCLRSRGEPQRIVVKIAKLPKLFTLSATRTRSDVRLSGVKRTSRMTTRMSANDPKRKNKGERHDAGLE